MTKNESSTTQIFLIFLKLGLTSFGGPMAHLGFFREEFVRHRRWLTEASYGDLVALCQFLPGPASSQVGYAIGLMRGGTAGAIAAWTGFTLPSAIMLIAFAYGVTALGDVQHAGWLQGLKIAAVAVVAKAVWEMAGQLCPDRQRTTIALFAAMAALTWMTAFTQVFIIVVGGILGWLLYRHQADPTNENSGGGAQRSSRRRGATFLAVFFFLMVGLPLLTATYPATNLKIFESFYRSGALVFGGGHVVLPLLQAKVVPSDWITGDDFLAGYGAAQAVPGPLFSFAAYLGAAMTVGPGGWMGGLLTLVAIFIPSLLLVQGVLPFWDTLRRVPSAQAALRGTNAAVVGMLLAALYNPVWIKGIHGPHHFSIALGAFALLHFWKAPPWLIVVLSMIAGMVFLN
jgi:chromate transporter